MSHHKHTIESFILSVMPVRDHDARVKMVTKDGEMITAVVTGVRLNKSKMRQALQEYATAQVSFVLGKESFRITNAVPIHNYFHSIGSKEGKASLARVVSLVKKLAPFSGQVGNAFEYLKNFADSLDSGEIEIRECQTVLFILTELGYMELNDEWKNVGFIKDHKKALVEKINQSIKSTQLM